MQETVVLRLAAECDTGRCECGGRGVYGPAEARYGKSPQLFHVH